MKITRKFLLSFTACKEGIKYYATLPQHDVRFIIESLLLDDPEGEGAKWANWTLARLLARKKRIQYALHCASTVLPYFERIFPNDKRPREAIELTQQYLDGKNNKSARSARSAESAESAARSAALSAAWNAESAARSAALSAESAESAESAAVAKKDDVFKKQLTAFVRYGLELLESANEPDSRKCGEL